MNNFPVNIDGKEYWISRSTAVVGLVFTNDEGLKILAGKRGKACPDEVGKWCLPCGYVDYDETVKDACIREIKEETNLIVDKDSLFFLNYNDDLEGKQNITFRFFSYGANYSKQTITGKFADKDEVDEVKWIRLDEIGNYDWAFNHKNLIADIVLNKLCSYCLVPTNTITYLIHECNTRVTSVYWI